MFFKRLFSYPRVMWGLSHEILWSQIWHDTIRGMDWIQDLPSVSPGRWAVGYNYLYVMTRILNDIRPHKVLDLGLGISSVLFSTYFSYFDYEDGQHIIAEHNPAWIDFFQKERSLSKASEIKRQTLVDKKYWGGTVPVYKELPNDVRGMKFQVISIDAYYFPRLDILSLLPDILEDDFVIVFDDTHDKKIKRTVSDAAAILRDRGIQYEIGWYRGHTDCTVIASSNYKFLTSL